ncbi:uncharacterized protein TOL2_C26370 [Desulfobacula toluolica Tol2]|uniref:Uncharacterized protein n=1 Tax=Desulfobacula toluolica (strain DSM 7467 / Tol2) TaxID=651182 RepID=K0NHM0_DESTT|nr:uncharacterized protein TOL2_C26370 [Desulfobacula toluolica Tol2]
MLKHKILCWYGKDPFEAGKILMESSGIWKNWSFLDHIGLKPNLVVSKKASFGATTHPELCAGIITFLQKKRISEYQHSGRFLGGGPNRKGF